jgi:hypothetical protein
MARPLFSLLFFAFFCLAASSSTAYSAGVQETNATAQTDQATIGAIFDELRGRVRPGRALGQPGTTDTHGSFFLVAVGIPVDEEDFIRKGRTIALKEIGAFIGVEVSAESEIIKRSETTIVDGEKHTEFFKSFSTATRTSIQERLTGVGLFTVEESEDLIHLGFLLSERDSQAAVNMKQAMETRDSTRTAVRAIGLASLNDGIANARTVAVERALREAIRKTAGTTILSQDAQKGSEFLDEQVFTSTHGFCSSYEVLQEAEMREVYRVEVLAVVDPERVVENFRDHLALLGQPKVFLSEQVYGDGWNSNRESPLASQLRSKLSGAGFSLGTGPPEEADFQLWLDSTWTQVKHPINKRNGMQLQADLYWVDRSGQQASLLHSDGRISKFVSGSGAARGCADALIAREWTGIQTRLQERLDSFLANGREVRAFLEGLDSNRQEQLLRTLRSNPLILDCSLLVDRDRGSSLSCKTLLRGGDLANLIRKAAGTQIEAPIDLSVLHAQNTEVRLAPLP